ncbi:MULTISPECIES: hypothetical protein [unclassified Haladaptatus]|uniref:DUF7535 family protein n=1 Tax=unclassified Haladaptatus TaxID=2622732 RepID=UPI00209BF7DF|nr:MULTISPECIES: hypothetical protein [unclassified Haladaptatus]MCO8242445.1 hypothetical protein [Haladaptatus sp. AB643]MCO8252202.1 hypothetical protein [Haladaptatus sp. AB618]
MSQEESEDHPVTKVVRTVTPPYYGHSDREMNTIGAGIFLGLLVLLIPLLPFLIIVWVISKLTDELTTRAPVGDEE